MAPTSHQGHINAANFVGGIYNWGQGVAVDYPRAMAAYKVGAEGGGAGCQHHVGYMYCYSLGVDVDYKQALPWIEQAAAQDQPDAVGQLGGMYREGKGVTPSWRRARGYYERAIELGSSKAVENMQTLTQSIQNVTSQRSNHFRTLHHSCATSRFRTLCPVPRTRAGHPSHGQAGGGLRHKPRGPEWKAWRRHRLPLVRG